MPFGRGGRGSDRARGVPADVLRAGKVKAQQVAAIIAHALILTCVELRNLGAARGQTRRLAPAAGRRTAVLAG